MARLNFKRAVAKLIVKIQAYKFNLNVIHTQKFKQHIKKIIPQMIEFHAGDENYFGEDYFSENEPESEESDEEDYVDPYTVAERLHRKGEHNPITR